MKKIISVLVAVTIVCTGVYFAFFNKTDEDKIVERFEDFETAYASGDLSKCLECMDSTSRNAMKGVGKITTGLGLLDSEVIDGLFSLGVAAGKQAVKFNVQTIRYTDDTHATVTVDILLLPEKETETEDMEVVKEGKDWYLYEDISKDFWF